MWILSVLPDKFLDIIFMSLLVIGMLGSILEMFLKYLPFLTQYRIQLKIISLIFVIIGIYYQGIRYAEESWKDRILAAEEKVRIAEAKSQQTNTIIQEKVVENIKVVKEKVFINRNIIKKQKEYINSECKIPDVALTIYNNSVRNSTNE